MDLKKKFVKTFEIFFSDENLNSTQKGDFSYENFLKEFADNSNTQKIKELQTVVYGLSSKVTQLIEKVCDLDSKVAELATLNEELLYTVEQKELEAEDNDNPPNLNYSSKKYELN